MANENDQEIKITFDTNAKDAAKDSNTLGKSLDTVEKKTGTLSKSNAELSKTQKDAKKSGDEQKAGFEDLGSGIGDTIGQVKGLGKQFLALLANPIILFLAAIVAALALLFKAFTSTNDGADKMERVMAAVGATIDVLRDRFLKLWNALTSFDFEGIKASFSGITDEIEKEAAKAAELAGALQEVEDATRSLGVSRAKLNRDLAESKELITDETASYADKKKAIEAVKNAEGAQTAQELANAKKKYNAIRDQNALSDSSDEALQKEADALSAVYALEQKSADDRRSIRKTELRADNEERARLKTIADERKAANKARLDQLKEVARAKQALLDEEFNAEKTLLRKIQDLNDKTDEEKLARQKERDLADIEALKKKGIDTRDLLIYNNELYVTLEQELAQKRAEEKAKFEKEQYDKESEAKNIQADKDLADQKKIDDAMLQQEKDIQNSRVNLAESFVNFLKQIAGKNKALQKAAIIVESALGIGKSLIANTTANAGALATPQAILTSGASAVPVIAFNNISTGLGIASNIAATAKALQAVGGGSAPSAGGGMSGSGGSTPPSVAFNNTAENQIGQSVARTQGDLPPLKVYVEESDISKAQNNVKVLVNKNTF